MGGETKNVLGHEAFAGAAFADDMASFNAAHSTLNSMSGEPSVAFFADVCMLPGLHVALFSMLANWSKHGPAPRIHVFHESLPDSEVEALRKMVAEARTEAVLACRRFDPAVACGLKSLHGNHMAYGRFFLAELLPDTDRVIYLDSDLVVQTDLGALWNVDLRQSPVGGVSRGTFRTALESTVCGRLGIPLDTPYFNSGVLLLDLARWRETNLKDELVQFTVDNPACVFSADQSSLNLVCHDRFALLPDKYNMTLEPGDRAGSIHEEAIIHFLGSPKPFDPGGCVLSNQWAVFRHWHRQLALRPSLPVHFMRSAVWLRTLRTGRSSWRQIKRLLTRAFR